MGGKTPGPWTALSTGSKGGRRVCAEKPDASYHEGRAEILIAEVFGGVLPDEGSFGPWSQPAADQRSGAEKEANAALICAAPTYLAALQEIAGMDIRRCSAGYLQEIARKALGMNGVLLADGDAEERVAYIVCTRDRWGMVRKGARLMLTETGATEHANLLRQTHAGWLERETP